VTGGAPEIPFRDLISLDLDPRRAGERALQNKGDAGTFEEVLARELRQHLNSDIVQRAQVILRDRGEGIIRLSLRPESLGHVKIRLELTENKIAGRIIVESGEALRAFEREIGSLEQAFRDSGYESAELSAFLAQDGQGSGTYQGEEKPFYSPGLAGEAASRYDEADETRERTDTSFPDLSGNGFGPGNRHIQVNILI
jgi:flagellar hook-length control protein FliK